MISPPKNRACDFHRTRLTHDHRLTDVNGLHNPQSFARLKSPCWDRLDNLQTKGVDTHMADRMQEHTI